MRAFSEVWRSTIFTKWVMAITGIMLVLFLVAHLSGNLLVFLGAEHTNAYAVELREMLHGSAIWVARAGLIVAFVLHILSAYSLASRNRAARPEKYVKVEPKRSTLASRTMLLSGTMLLVYLLYHLAHFTWGIAHPDYSHHVDALGRHDVYRMVVESFHEPLIAILYIIAMILMGMHLNHAISSAFQTLGVTNPRVTPMIRTIGPALGLLLTLGFSSIPVAILFGLVK